MHPNDTIEYQCVLKDNQALARRLSKLNDLVQREILPLMRGLDSSNIRMNKTLALQIKKALMIIENITGE